MPEAITDTKVFLLTTSSPEHGGIGTLFIRDILTRASDIKTVWYVEKPFLLKIDLACCNRLGSVLNSLLVRIGVWQNLRFYMFVKYMLAHRVKAIEEAFYTSGANLIWVTTSSPELICIAALLAERGFDLRVTVWDAPEYLLQNLGFSKRNCTLVQGYFAKLMSRVKAASVVSDDMHRTYRERFPGLELTLMRHGIAPLARPAQTVQPAPIRFVFAGSLYSKQEWNAFIEALELANWHLSGRAVKLAFIGRFPLKGAERPSSLVHIEPMPQNAALLTMSEMDIGYLPYWLDPSKEFVARTSFPGKMTAYSAAGLDIFHHGPRSSSVTRFLAKYPYGVACDSLDPKVVLDHLERLVKSFASPERIQARRYAMDEALSDIAMMGAFRQLVDVMPKGHGRDYPE